MVKLSPSALSLYTDCPRCFYMEHNENVKRPSGIFPSLPSGMDKILKEHFDKYIGKGLPPELALNDVKLYSDTENLKKWRSRKGISWMDNDGNVLHGAIDNLLEHKGKLIVLDYKTRGFPLKEDTAGHYKDQLDIYNFLFRKNGFPTEDYSYLLFFYPKEVDSKGDIVFHKELVKMAVDVDSAYSLFVNALKSLKGKKPEANKECEWCEYRTK